MSFLNYKFDNSVENENVLDIGKLQNKIGNTLEREVNEIKDNLNTLAKNNTTTLDEEIGTVPEKEEKQVNDKKLNTTKTNVGKNDTKENKKTNEKAVTTNNKNTQDKVENGISVKVKLLYDLIEECNDEAEKQKLLADNQKIVQTIIGRTIDKTNIQKEYEIR